MLFAGPGSVSPAAAGAIALLVVALWSLGLRLHDVSIVDVACGPAFAVVALISALLGNGSSDRRWLCSV